MATLAGTFEKSYLGTALAGEGGIASTVDDMLRWLAHMDNPVIGTATTWQLIKAPLSLVNGATTGYGLGLISDRYRGADTISHAGGVLGGNSQLIKVPIVGLDVVVLVNRHDVLGMRLANRIIDACITGLDPEEVAQAASASGTFRSAVTNRVIQLLDNEGQQIASIDGFDLPCLRQGVLLRPIPEYSSIKQTLILQGDRAQPTSILLDDFGNVDELHVASPVNKASFHGMAGTYRSDTTRTEAVISESGDGAQMKTFGRFGSMEFSLECIADGIWRARPANAPFPLGGVLSFDPVNTGFSFSTSRMRLLPFRRVP